MPANLVIPQTLTNVAATSRFDLWTVTVPAGATKLVVRTSGGSGRLDLYVRRGTTVSSTQYDCRVLNFNSQTGTSALCSIDAPAAGEWTIGVDGSYSGVTLDVNPTN